MSLDAATIKLLLAKESLARKAADLNLRRYAIMQSVIDNHNNKRKMDRDEAAKVAKKGKTSDSAADRDAKIAKLLSCLDDILDLDKLDEMEEAIGNTALSLAIDLQYYGRVRVLDDDELLSPGGVSFRSGRAGSVKRSLTVSELFPQVHAIGPWKSATIPDHLPMLPCVLDPILEKGAFIHQGYSSGGVTDMSYERLEWLGDGFIYYLSSVLISKTFPSLLPGKCSQLRERLVKNATLSKYARQYGFEERAKLPSSFSLGSFRRSRDMDKTKILGDIFEAYVYAAIISDPEAGVTRVCAWLKDLWGMTLKKEIIEEEKHGMKFNSPLWKDKGNNGADAVQGTLLNYKENLQKVLGSKNVKLEYKDAAPVKKDKETKLPLFTIGVYLTGWGAVDKLLGTGSAHGKKEAGMKAAKMALDNKSALRTFMEKKRAFDAQQELEKQALANA